MAPELRPLAEQVMVITGASSGIGLVTARMAAESGTKLVLAARHEPSLRALVEEIEAGGGSAIAVAADVGREEDVARIAQEAVEHFGRFDTWVNNAGVSIFGNIVDVSVRDMHRVFDTVFWGAAYGCLQATAHFRARGEGEPGGAIINVGSVFGDRITPLQSTYGSAKHALHGWTDALRMELEHEDAPVSVTLLHPGRIDTPYNEHAQSYIERQPAHRGMVYPPEAVAEAILYAAEHPTRDLFIGGQVKLATTVGRLAPRLMDKVMERWMYPTQQATDRPSMPREASALHEGRGGLRERGSHEGWFRRRSLYLEASTHPRARNAAVLATGVAATAALAARSGGR